MMRLGLSIPAAAMLMLTGCCTSISTVVRNETGTDIRLTTVCGSRQIETVTIRAHSTGRCAGIMEQPPTLVPVPPPSWIISDGHSRFVFDDVSLIATLPDAFISSSRFTRDFPCNRISRHVSITPEMTIHADRVIGYTASEPPPFPIHYSREKIEK